MKRTIIASTFTSVAFILAVFLVSCSSPKQLTSKESPKIQASAQDSTQYQILFFDNNFETWFELNKRPESFYPESYYASQNRILSQQWNSAVISNNYQPPFSYEIDYDPNADYGLDVNYKLYYYFKYLETIVGPINALP